jgi:hypothetical protein
MITWEGLEDTPEVRLQLATMGIPKCASWRRENNQPYCPSAYCARCAGLRYLDGVDPVVPNGDLLAPYPRDAAHPVQFSRLTTSSDRLGLR